MAEFVEVPVGDVEEGTLTRLLDEYCSRDGTDYGLTETPVPERVAQMRRQLASFEARLLFDVASEEWDIVPAEQAKLLLGQRGHG